MCEREIERARERDPHVTYRPAYHRLLAWIATCRYLAFWLMGIKSFTHTLSTEIT